MNYEYGTWQSGADLAGQFGCGSIFLGMPITLFVGMWLAVLFVADTAYYWFVSLAIAFLLGLLLTAIVYVYTRLSMRGRMSLVLPFRFYLIIRLVEHTLQPKGYVYQKKRDFNHGLFLFNKAGLILDVTGVRSNRFAVTSVGRGAIYYNVGNETDTALQLRGINEGNMEMAISLLEKIDTAFAHLKHLPAGISEIEALRLIAEQVDGASIG